MSAQKKAAKLFLKFAQSLNVWKQKQHESPVSLAVAAASTGRLLPSGQNQCFPQMFLAARMGSWLGSAWMQRDRQTDLADFL
jgi:hypothetical protein